VGLHVDNCLGGYYLSFAQQAGLLQDLRWDFGVPGVTSHGRKSHLHAPLYIFYTQSLRKYAGRCLNDFAAHG
jgi:hypothetical protein